MYKGEVEEGSGERGEVRGRIESNLTGRRNAVSQSFKRLVSNSVFGV